MSKSYCSLGLMSGTSADGVDASIIQSNGDNEYKVILDKYFVYSQDIYENIHNLKDKISNSKDLENLSNKIELLEKVLLVPRNFIDRKTVWTIMRCSKPTHISICSIRG